MSAVAKARALAGGAIGFITQLLAKGTSGFAIFGRLRQAYRGMSSQEAADVYYTGIEAWNAGVDLARATQSQPLQPADVPVNPDLFPQGSFGYRYRTQFTGAYIAPGETSPRYATISVPSISAPTMSDIMAQWEAFLGAPLDSPTLAQAVGGAGSPAVTNLGIIQILNVERLY